MNDTLKDLGMKVPKLSLSAQTFIGLISGIIVGLFFGEKSQVLEPIGTIYVNILQVSLLPFVITSIIANIGGLNSSDARPLAKKGSLAMLMIWAIGIIALFSMQLTFPDVSAASFYSPNDILNSRGSDLIDVFIPSNIFRSLSEGDLPAVVLFSFIVGFILIGDKKNKPLIALMDGLSTAFSRLNRLLSRLCPLGIFFIMANTAGTLTIERFIELQVYIITLAVASILLILLVLPLLASCFTSFAFKDILSASSKAVILGASTGNIFITLQLISEEVQNLFQSIDIKGKSNQDVRSYSEILVPMAYIVPKLGSFASFLFILFAAWFYNNSLGLAGQLTLLIIGIPSSFGSSAILIPFLLNLMHLPAKAFDLYIGSSLITHNILAPLSIMSIFTFTIICISLLIGPAQFRLKKMLPGIFLIIVVFAIAIIGLKLGFAHMLANPYHGEEIVGGMDLPKQESWRENNTSLIVIVYKNKTDLPKAGADNVAAGSTLDRIKHSGVLRVGYSSDAIPFAFFNKKGSLVGYDVEMAYELAQFLGVSKLEFVPISYGSMAESLKQGTCDLVMAGISMTHSRMEDMKFTRSYMTLHLAMIVRDHRKNEFLSLEEIQKMEGLRVAVENGTIFQNISTRLFPRAALVKLNNTEEFFTGDKADALLTTAEGGSVMTVLHPYYDVAVFQPDDAYKVLLAYPIALNGDEEFLRFLNGWLETESAYGELDKKYEYWILGKQAQNNATRWSVARNILHWWS